ncbi:hypothetical protein U1Q18_038402 [Sarracenia purpurea var. burkii]
MVIVEVATVGLSTLFKAAASKGMSYCVFIVYSFAISSLVVALLAFFYRFASQMLGYKGIEYSDPTLNSAISNLVPAFTFALAIIFRMENVSLTSASSQAKIIGTVVSISGALVVVLYAGPTVIRSSSLPSPASSNKLLSSSQSEWILGGLLLAVDYMLLSVWYIVQAQTVKKYPAEFIIVFLYNLCVTIISAPVCLIVEPNLNKWKLRADIALIAILYAGVVGSSFGTVAHTWNLRVKGPVYVTLFRPLSIVIAAIMGVIFLGNALYLGSVIGAVLISVGFYVVMWGKAKEERVDTGADSLETPFPENVPLLQ